MNLIKVIHITYIGYSARARTDLLIYPYEHEYTQ